MAIAIWDSTAHLRPATCFHPNGGIDGSWGSGLSLRNQQVIPAICSKISDSSKRNHLTGGRRRRMKNPASQPALPDLLPPLEENVSSDGLEDEKDAKRPRSTSTTPRSGKGLEPYEYDRLMGAPSVGSTSDELGDGEGTEADNLEENPDLGGTNDSLPGLESGSGVGESLRGVGSASHLEVLNRSRMPRLEVPAACASQSAMELLGIEQNPQQEGGPRRF